jgi:hypothetical protein
MEESREARKARLPAKPRTAPRPRAIGKRRRYQVACIAASQAIRQTHAESLKGQELPRGGFFCTQEVVYIGATALCASSTMTVVKSFGRSANQGEPGSVCWPRQLRRQPRCVRLLLPDPDTGSDAREFVFGLVNQFIAMCEVDRAARSLHY